MVCFEHDAWLEEWDFIAWLEILFSNDVKWTQFVKPYCFLPGASYGVMGFFVEATAMATKAPTKTSPCASLERKPQGMIDLLLGQISYAAVGHQHCRLICFQHFPLRHLEQRRVTPCQNHAIFNRSFQSGYEVASPFSPLGAIFQLAF